MSPKNKPVKKFFLIVYIGIVFVYLLTCLIPFLNPARFWFIALLGLGFPFLFLLVLICMIITAIKKSKWFFLSLAALLISWQQVFAIFALHAPKNFAIEKSPETLRVLSWNVSSWTETNYSPDNIDRTGLRNLMMDAIQMENADVLCFQEYFESSAPELFPANIPVLKKMGFTYFYFTPCFKMRGDALKTGLCIFSKYPIADSVFFKPADHSNSEGLSIVDINFNGRIVRVCNTHLESPRLTKQEYGAFNEVEESRTVLGKIKRAYSLRSQQAQMIRATIDTCKQPVILCGDFNDIPNSYSYFKIKDDLQDAFLKKGLGIGRTFQFISPTLRIDYMLAGRQFNIEQFKKLDYKYSDHYAQVMDVSLTQNK